MINSPGGDGLAAERIVNTCRAYSGTGDYWAIVPGKAKSAGTLIAMGASKIMMPLSAELGPVDPQIFLLENGRQRTFSAHGLVSGYDKLFNEAVASSGHLEPYLQQLNFYDDRDINIYRGLITLSEHISVKVLSSGMMSGKTADEVKSAIEIFLNPGAGTHSHGRPIYANEASACGFTVELLNEKTPYGKGYTSYTREPKCSSRYKQARQLKVARSHSMSDLVTSKKPSSEQRMEKASEHLKEMQDRIRPYLKRLIVEDLVAERDWKTSDGKVTKVSLRK